MRKKNDVMLVGDPISGQSSIRNEVNLDCWEIGYLSNSQVPNSLKD
jgi:hypothetical protein